MNSSGHRANILGNFTDIGTALIQANGTTWAVQVFANYPGSGLPAPAPAAPAPAPAAPAPAPAAPAPAPAAPAPAPVPGDAAASADTAPDAAADGSEPAPSGTPAESAAPMTPSPAPSPKHGASTAPNSLATPGPEASESIPIVSVGPWVAAGMLALVAIGVALWPWVATRVRRRGPGAGA